MRAKHSLGDIMYYIRGASFWQQNQIWQARLQQRQQELDATSSLTSVISASLTNLTKGFAGIANQRALTRVQAQLKAAAAAAGTGQASSANTTGNSVNKTA
jgi:hypothetical protein